VNIEEFSFAGDDQGIKVDIKDWSAFADSSGSYITSPEWNVDATSKTVCYIRGSAPLLDSVKLSIDGGLGDTSIHATLTGDATVGDTVLTFTGDVTLTGDSVTIDELQTEGSLQNYLDYQDIEISWKLKFDDESEQDLGTTSNPIMIIWGYPQQAAWWGGDLDTIPTATRIQYLLELDGMVGEDDPDTIAWTVATNEMIANYFGTSFSIVNNNPDVWKILDGLGADCISQSALMEASLAVLGIGGAQCYFVHACHRDAGYLTSDSPETDNQEWRVQGDGNTRLGYFAKKLNNGGFFYNNYEGCCCFNGIWYMGGEGGSNCSSPEDVLIWQLTHDANGELHPLNIFSGPHQVYFDQQATATSPVELPPALIPSGP